jgi:dTDP-4-amino-4,6-dideoxygalactose transaminase
MRKIPLVNLQAQHNKLKGRLLRKIEEVIDSSEFILGRYVEEFEGQFAEAVGAKYAVGCSSGTSAVSLALEALEIGSGDEVITVSNTFFATAEAICNVGATPVFVDINPDSYTMSISALEKAITDKTKAIIPVHIFGIPCNMRELMKFAKKHGLYVIEDCAQAHLAKFDGQHVGTFGHIGAFSFFPGKNLGALGDAGAIITNSAVYAEKIRKLRNHGRTGKYEHEIVGYNHRMDGIQAAVLSVKLEYLPEWTARRIQNAAIYDARLDNLGIKRTITPPEGQSVYHLYVVEIAKREVVVDYLSGCGIQTGVHYPTPLHLQPALNFLGGHHGDFPVTEAASKRILSLPMCPELLGKDIEYICDKLSKANTIGCM